MAKVLTATGQAPADITLHGFMLGAGSGHETSNTTVNLTAGQIFIGVTGGAPVPATLTAGDNVTIDSEDGQITINASSGSGGFTIVDQTTTTVTMQTLTKYIVNNASLVTLTLPALAAVGDVFMVIGKGAGGWQVNVASGQTIQVSSTACTISTGHIASTNRYDCVTLECVTANTLFVCHGITGGLTVT